MNTLWLYTRATLNILLHCILATIWAVALVANFPFRWAKKSLLYEEGEGSMLLMYNVTAGAFSVILVVFLGNLVGVSNPYFAAAMGLSLYLSSLIGGFFFRELVGNRIAKRFRQEVKAIQIQDRIRAQIREERSALASLEGGLSEEISATEDATPFEGRLSEVDDLGDAFPLREGESCFDRNVRVCTAYLVLGDERLTKASRELVAKTMLD